MSSTKGKRYFATFYSMNRANRVENNTLEVYGPGISSVIIPNDCFYIRLFSIDACLKVANIGRVDRRNVQDEETWVVSDRCRRAIGLAVDAREQMGIYAFQNSKNALNSSDLKGGRYTPESRELREAGEDE